MIEYNEYKLKVCICNYQNDNLAIALETDIGEPFTRLTVNLEKLYEDDEAYIDTNNFPAAEELIEKYDLGKFTGRYGYSGFCTYPLYKFNMLELKKHCN